MVNFKYFNVFYIDQFSLAKNDKIMLKYIVDIYQT